MMAYIKDKYRGQMSTQVLDSIMRIRLNGPDNVFGLNSYNIAELFLHNHRIPVNTYSIIKH
jgi:hypothetical protein